jgi:hypothetical protein
LSFLLGRLAKAISFVTNHRRLVTNGIASARPPRNDRMTQSIFSAGNDTARATLPASP